MEKIISWMVEKLWKKWWGFIILILAASSFLITVLPEQWDVFDSEMIKFLIHVVLAFIVILLCFISCVKENCLPKAKRNQNAVLFVIDTESDDLVNDIKNKLIANFADNFSGDDKYRFVPVCIKKDKLKKYNLDRENEVIKVLYKTNCLFVVKIKLHVDNIRMTENYDIAIRYGIIHPKINEEERRMLQTEMAMLAMPIHNNKFTKQNAIETFHFTAQALSEICQYLLAFVYLITGSPQRSYDILKTLLNRQTCRNDFDKSYNIEKLIKQKLYISCIGSYNADAWTFYTTKSETALKDLNEKLEEANKLIPNTYSYHLGKAYYLMAHDLDSKSAKTHIDFCKKFKTKDEWKYSEAFLTAYSGKTPKEIVKKYSMALKTGAQNLLQIVDYIEYILEKAPDHVDLYLAAALVYDEMKNYEVARELFEQYKTYAKSKDIGSFIDEKIASYPKSLI